MEKELTDFGSKSRETLERPERRNFTAKYKRDILNEVDACRESGDIELARVPSTVLRG